MALRHLIIAAVLAGFAPAVLPVIAIDKAEAAETVKKKKKKPVQKKRDSGVKKNFSGPRPGEPDAGWSDQCIFLYNVYGRKPAFCGKYGRG
jgi:hypothetical protein